MKLLGIAAIIVSLSIGYYFVIYIPQKDKEQRDLQQQQLKQQADIQTQKAQEIQKQIADKKQALSTCLSNASEGYGAEWRSDCRSMGLLPAGCDEATINLSFVDYQKQNKLSGMQGWDDYWKAFSQKLDTCTCALPFSLSDRVNNNLQQAKDTCFKEYPQN